MSVTNSRLSSAAKIKKMVMAAMFCALAFAAIFVMRINVVFLTFDAKDAIVTIAGLLFGPIYALVISLVVSLLELIAIGDTGFWGFLMDFLSTAIFSCSASLVYSYKKNMKGAIGGLSAAVFSMTSFMLLFNLFIVPLYTPSYTTAAVAAMIPSLFLPFNLTKGVLNAALVLILYKPASTAMKAAHVLPSEKKDAVVAGEKRKSNIAFSLAITAVGFVAIAVCLVVFFVLLDGKFDLVKEVAMNMR